LHRAVSLNRPQDRAPPTVLNFLGNPENHLPKGFLGRSWLPHSLSGGSHGFLEPLELVVRQKHVVSGTNVKVPLRVVERSSQLRRPTPEGRHLRKNRPKSSSPFQRRECGPQEGTEENEQKIGQLTNQLLLELVVFLAVDLAHSMSVPVSFGRSP